MFSGLLALLLALPIHDGLLVDSKSQTLAIVQDGKTVKSYPVSTAKNGLGTEYGSNKTPTGLHSVASKFGKGLPERGVLQARKATKEIAPLCLEPKHLDKDYVTSRILWLQGEETGINKGGKKDSYQRHIYIHGTPEEGLIGRPASHGCIRMRNADVIELFAQVPVGTRVYIQ